MKKIKIALIIILSLISLLLLIAAIQPSTYKVERSILISRTPALISKQIFDVKKWQDWSPWIEQDKNAKYIFNDTSGVGSQMSWSGEIIGKGTMRITAVEKNKINYSLSFIEPFESKSVGSFLLNVADKSTSVTWTNEGNLSFPIGRLMYLFMNFDEMMGPDFEKGLIKLKQKCETIKDYTYEVKEKNIASIRVAYINNVIPLSKISETIDNSYREIAKHVLKHGGRLIGYPMTITNNFNSESWDFDAALPIDRDIETNNKIKIKNTYSGKVLYVEYFGPYNKTTLAYIDIARYLKENNYATNGEPCEVYLTDPTSEPDTMKWKTEILFPVK